MLSKKSFLAAELKFSAPQAHPTCADVRGHIESQESDHRASYLSYRGLQQRRQLKTDPREILGAAQFSTFSTASVNRVISLVSWWRLLNPNDWTYLPGIGDSESGQYRPSRALSEPQKISVTFDGELAQRRGR
jgi:hypothetical protein